MALEIWLPEGLWLELKRSYLGIGKNSKYYLKGVRHDLMTEIKHVFYSRWKRRLTALVVAAHMTRTPLQRYRLVRDVIEYASERLHLVHAVCRCRCCVTCPPKSACDFLTELPVRCEYHLSQAREFIAHHMEHKRPYYKQKVALLEDMVRICESTKEELKERPY